MTASTAADDLLTQPEVHQAWLHICTDRGDRLAGSGSCSPVASAVSIEPSQQAVAFTDRRTGRRKAYTVRAIPLLRFARIGHTPQTICQQIALPHANSGEIKPARGMTSTQRGQGMRHVPIALQPNCFHSAAVGLQ